MDIGPLKMDIAKNILDKRLKWGAISTD